MHEQMQMNVININDDGWKGPNMIIPSKKIMKDQI